MKQNIKKQVALVLLLILTQVPLPKLFAAQTAETPLLQEAEIAATSITVQPIPKQSSTVKSTIVIDITGYSSTPDQTDDTPFTMANGKRVHDGAVATNFLPFGTRVRIPSLYGDKIFIVEDRMNKRYYHRMDIWFSTREAALQFGKQHVEIEIL